MMTMERRQQISSLLDQYDSLKGKARSQTHRDAIGNQIAVLLLAERSEAQAKAAPAKVTKAPSDWPRTKTSSKWGGVCRACGLSGERGHVVAWKRNSGIPSVWQHLTCDNPFGIRGARK